MPAIPLFQSTEGYGFTPLGQTSPGEDSAAATALATGASQVAGAAEDLGARLNQHFALAQEQQQKTQQLVQASAIESQGAIDIGKMRLDSLKDPDYTNAGTNFLAKAQTYKTNALAGIQDPKVQAYVSQALDKHVSANGIAVMADALKNGNAAQAASIGGDIDTAVSSGAAAPNDAALKLSIDGINAKAQGGVQAQLYTPLQARAMTSAAVRQIVTLRSLTDPAGAQSVMAQYGSLLTAQDRVLATEHLQPLINRAIGAAGGSSAFAAATGSGDAGGSSDVADAIHGQESGGRANSATSVDGAQGGWQVTPGTFSQYAQPGESISVPADNERVGRRIVADLSQKFGGDPARIAVGYFSGPGNVAPAGSPTPWVADKKDGNGTSVSSYVSGVLGRMGGGGKQYPPIQGDPSSSPDPANAPGMPSGPVYPDDEIAMQRISELPAEAQPAAMTHYQQLKHRFLAGQNQERVAMSTQVTNTLAGLNAGLDVDAPTESTIRRLYPQAQADQILDKLQEGQQFGLLRRNVDLATPDDISTMRQQLADGTGLLPRMLALKGKAGSVATGDAPAAPDGVSSTDGLALRLKQQGMLEAVIKKRNEDLAADPAMFVATRDPSVKPLADAVTANPNDAAASQTFSTALMASQSRLGVPPAQQRILTNGQVQAEAQALSTTDPATADMGKQLDGLAQRYGGSWPKAFGELVSVGKISPAYQVLAGMDVPGQATARQDLQRVLQLSAQKGGLAGLKKDAPPDQVRAIEAGLDDTMSPFRATTGYTQGGIQLLTTMRGAVEHLALYNAMRGQSASDALASAYQGIVGEKYDTGGTDGAMLVPKGQLPQVSAAANQVVSGLKPEDLQPTPDMTGVRTDAQQRAMTMTAAQRGVWVPNQDASGLVLMGKYANGAVLPIQRADGSRVELKFGALPTPAVAGPTGFDPAAGQMVTP